MADVAKAPFNASLNEQRTQANIELESKSLCVTTEQLESAIAHLGLLRSQMQPPVSLSLEESRLLPLDFLEAEPIGNVASPTGGGVLFSARSTYFGWFRIHMSPEWCAGLVLHLTGKNISPPPDATIN
jgi:hypothetical protein